MNSRIVQRPCPLPVVSPRLLWAFAALVSSLSAFGADLPNDRWRLEFVSDLNIPTGTPYEAVGQFTQPSGEVQAETQDPSLEGIMARKASGVFGGISAIAFDEKSSTLLALSDSSTPTAFPFTLAVTDDKLRLKPKSLIRFRNKDGSALPAWTIDPEGIALSPNGTLFISSEGYVARMPPVSPAIFEFSADGRLLRDFTVPEKFLPAERSNSPRGVRVNKGLESLTLSPDATRLYTATEHPLLQDEPGCGLDQPCAVRLLEFALDGDGARAIHEYQYVLDPLTTPEGFPVPAGGVQGLPDLLSLGGGELFAIERGYMADQQRNGRNRIRIYHLNVDGATDILSASTSVSKTLHIPVRKSLVLDLDDILDQLEPGFRTLDNFEGICFGPQLDDGSRCVILVSDNNFSTRQRTVFLLFRLTRN